MAYAGALFAEMCLRGLNGEPNVEEYAFVQSTVVPGLPFFSSKVKLGPTGAPDILPAVLPMGNTQTLPALRGTPSCGHRP